MKLTVRMRHVLDRLAEGWELGVEGGLVALAWLQQDGLGRGGETEKVSMTTLHALTARGLIRHVTVFPARPTRYALTPAGRAAQRDRTHVSRSL